MAAPEKVELSDEVEHGDIRTAGGHARGTIEYERAQLLASLPDPDAGKTDEERAAIVSPPPPIADPPPTHRH